MDSNTEVYNWKREADNVFYTNNSVFVLEQDMVEYLIRNAKKYGGFQSRVCLHQNHQDSLHEMVIVFLEGWYIPPHKHDRKIESFHVIEGRLAVIIFSNRGGVDKIIILGEEIGLYRLSKDLYHMVVPLSEHVVFHETTNGPFILGEMEVPCWAPDKGGDARSVFEYQKKINKLVSAAIDG